VWEAIDPAGNPKAEEEAQKAGVQKLQMQQLSKEKVSIGSLYLGLAFEYGDKTDKLPQLAQMEGLEYQISSIIKRLTTRKGKVAFVQGHEELGQSQGLQSLWAALKEDYDLQTIQLADKPERIPDDVDALMIVGPKKPAFTDEAKKIVDEFLMRGKGVGFLVDGMAIQQVNGMQGMAGMNMPRMVSSNASGIEPLLESYGFKIEPTIIMDEQNMRAPEIVNGQIYLVNLPYFPVATRLGAHDVTQKLRGVLFPLSSSVQVQGAMKELQDKKAAGGGAELVALATSSDKSWKETGFMMIDATHEYKPGPDKEKGPFTFGWAYKGPLKSAYAGAAPAMSNADAKAPASESKGPVRMVVIGNSDFASDQFMQSREIAMQNGHFFLNIIDWLLQDETLTPVRGKGVTQRPLEVRNESTPVLVKTGNMLGLPLLFIGYGVVRRWRRRSQREATHE
jgi:ABC-type uncharacterized transport system involved in gliding motility auxiliary subunit